MPERFAIYYAPAVSDPLWERALAWFRKPWLHPHSVLARKYGFHGTLKAPFALAPDATREGLERTAREFAAATAPTAIGTMQVNEIGGGFLALMPEVQTAALGDLASECILAFDRFRAPLTEMERARRLPGLTGRQVELLDLWGYPYVLEEFLFHMTLTDRLEGETAASTLHAAREHFAPHLGQELVLDRIVIFREAGDGSPFVRLNDYPLTGA